MKNFSVLSALAVVFFLSSVSASGQMMGYGYGAADYWEMLFWMGLFGLVFYAVACVIFSVIFWRVYKLIVKPK